MSGADSQKPSKAKITESLSAVVHHRGSEFEFKVSQVNSLLKLSKKQYSQKNRKRSHSLQLTLLRCPEYKRILNKQENVTLGEEKK